MIPAKRGATFGLEAERLVTTSTAG
jgi:hypothetical protein